MGSSFQKIVHISNFLLKKKDSRIKCKYSFLDRIVSVPRLIRLWLKQPLNTFLWKKDWIIHPFDSLLLKKKSYFLNPVIFKISYLFGLLFLILFFICLLFITNFVWLKFVNKVMCKISFNNLLLLSFASKWVEIITLGKWNPLKIAQVNDSLEYCG